MALSSYGGYFGAGSNSNTVIVRNFPTPTTTGYLGAGSQSNTVIIRNIPDPITSGYFSAGANSNTVTVENISKFIYVVTYDPTTKRPAPYVPVRVIWTLPDGTTVEKIYYSNAEGVAIIPVLEGATQVEVIYGNASKTITDPSKGGYVELESSMIAIIRVLDSASKRPIGGIQIDLGKLGTYTTDSNGIIKVPIPQHGKYTAKVLGGYRYYTQTFEIEVDTDVVAKDLYVSRRMPPIVR